MKIKDAMLSDPQRIATIRQLNDGLRTKFVGGVVLMTAALAQTDEEKKRRVLHRVRSFDDFTEKNDPYNEHDFGAFCVDGERFFFKHDYYDRQMKYGSEDPADPEKTTRVLTIGLMSDY
jgi:hypothetical protein